MSTQQQSLTHTQADESVNAHGTTVRQITVCTPDKVTEFFYQKALGVWILFKRIVHTVQ